MLPWKWIHIEHLSETHDLPCYIVATPSCWVPYYFGNPLVYSVHRNATSFNTHLMFTWHSHDLWYQVFPFFLPVFLLSIQTKDNVGIGHCAWWCWQINKCPPPPFHCKTLSIVPSGSSWLSIQIWYSRFVYFPVLRCRTWSRSMYTDHWEWLYKLCRWYMIWSAPNHKTGVQLVFTTRLKSIENVTRCRGSRLANSRETR